MYAENPTHTTPKDNPPDESIVPPSEAIKPEDDNPTDGGLSTTTSPKQHDTFTASGDMISISTGTLLEILIEQLGLEEEQSKKVTASLDKLLILASFHILPFSSVEGGVITAPVETLLTNIIQSLDLNDKKEWLELKDCLQSLVVKNSDDNGRDIPTETEPIIIAPVTSSTDIESKVFVKAKRLSLALGDAGESIMAAMKDGALKNLSLNTVLSESDIRKLSTSFFETVQSSSNTKLDVSLWFVKKFPSGQIPGFDSKIPLDNIKAFLCDVGEMMRPVLKMARTGVTVKIAISLVLGYFDNITDGLVTKKFYDNGMVGWGNATLGCLLAGLSA